MVWQQEALCRERNQRQNLHRCKTHMNSHQEEQDALLNKRNLDKKEALLRERNLTVSGNNSVHHQEVQNLQIKKTIQLMNIYKCSRWSHGRGSSWSMGSRRSSRWWLCSWTGNKFFYLCIKSLGPVWGRHYLFSWWGWSHTTKLFRWEGCCPQGIGVFAWTSASCFEKAVHWTCWLGEATMDRTSLLSFYKSMENWSATLLLQERRKDQFSERDPRWM